MRRGEAPGVGAANVARRALHMATAVVSAATAEDEMLVDDSTRYPPADASRYDKLDLMRLRTISPTRFPTNHLQCANHSGKRMLFANNQIVEFNLSTAFVRKSVDKCLLTALNPTP